MVILRTEKKNSFSAMYTILQHLEKKEKIFENYWGSNGLSTIFRKVQNIPNNNTQLSYFSKVI